MAAKRFRQQSTAPALVLVHVTVLGSLVMAGLILVYSPWMLPSQAPLIPVASIVVGLYSIGVVAGLYSLWVVLLWRCGWSDVSGTGLAWAALGVLGHTFAEIHQALLNGNAVGNAAGFLSTVAFVAGLALMGWNIVTSSVLHRT